MEKCLKIVSKKYDIPLVRLVSILKEMSLNEELSQWGYKIVDAIVPNKMYNVVKEDRKDTLMIFPKNLEDYVPFSEKKINVKALDGKNTDNMASIVEGNVKTLPYDEVSSYFPKILDVIVHLYDNDISIPELKVSDFFIYDKDLFVINDGRSKRKSLDRMLNSVIVSYLHPAMAGVKSSYKDLVAQNREDALYFIDFAKEELQKRGIDTSNILSLKIVI
jgi:hypothetical protein